MDVTIHDVVANMSRDKRNALYFLVGAAMEHPEMELMTILRIHHLKCLAKYDIYESIVLISLMKGAQGDGFRPMV